MPDTKPNRSSSDLKKSESMKVAGDMIRKGYGSFERWRSYANSRKQAREFRKEVVRENGKSHVTPSMLRSMKEEMKQRFGDPGHWPWIALYAELRGEYIPGWVPDDLYSFQMLPGMNPTPGAEMSTVKSFDHRLFPGFAIEPELIRINRAWFNSKMEPADPHESMDRLRREGRELVIKRDRSPSGEEIDFIRSEDLSMELFRNEYNYLVQPSLVQHESLAALYSGSVNTLRVTTFLREDGSIEIKHRSLRFGVGGKRIVNVSKGGLCFILTPDGAVSSSALDKLGLSRGEIHPDTGYRFSDLRVPSVPEAEERCRKAHLRFPYLRFIAWDLYIDTDGVPGMIEWNALRPDMWVNEALIGPLWSREQIDEILLGRNGGR